jgi:hypothetical protein
MNEWREKVALKVQAASNDCRFTPHINSTYDADQMPTDVARYIARAAIAELLPLMKAELAKDNEAAAQRVRDLIAASGFTDARVVALMTLEQRTAAIEAWEPAGENAPANSGISDVGENAKRHEFIAAAEDASGVKYHG